MVSVSIREDKAFIISGIVIFGSCLCFLWILFLFLPSTEKPWFVWLMISIVSVLVAGIIAIFTALLIGNKTIVCETFIAKVTFGRERKILKEDIYLIADVTIGKGGHFYVVYPKGYDLTLMKMQTSIYLSDVERTKMIQRDKDLLIVRKTKTTEELFQSFGYVSTLQID